MPGTAGVEVEGLRTLKIEVDAMIVKHIPQEVHDIARDVAVFAEYTAKSNVGQRTGNLFRNINMSGPRPMARGGWTSDVGVGRTAPYARWVEEGTGIYGPFKLPISTRELKLASLPITGAAIGGLRRKMLKFDVGWPGRFTIWRASVKGQKGQHYMRKAWHDTRMVYVPLRLKLAAERLGALKGGD